MCFVEGGSGFRVEANRKSALANHLTPDPLSLAPPNRDTVRQVHADEEDGSGGVKQVGKRGWAAEGHRAFRCMGLKAYQSVARPQPLFLPNESGGSSAAAGACAQNLRTHSV